MSQSQQVKIYFQLLNKYIDDPTITEMTDVSAVRQKLSVSQGIDINKIKIIVAGEDAVPRILTEPQPYNLKKAGWRPTPPFNTIILKLDTNYNHYLDEIGTLKYTDKNYIGNIDSFIKAEMTTKKRIEDSNKKFESYQFQLIIWSLVGGISIITLLMLFRKINNRLK